MSKRVKVCEFRAHNIKENNMTNIEIEIDLDKIYFINWKGERSHRYRSIYEAKEDIRDMYGEWCDFKMLI